jgi:hypothetical protein
MGLFDDLAGLQGGGEGGYGAATDLTGMMASGAASGLGGIADVVSGFVAKGQAKKELAKANENLESVLGNQPSLSTPGEYYDAVKNAYDQRLLQMRTDDINRSLATTAGAAQQFGARGLGAIMGAQSQAQRQMREEALTQQRLQTSALSNLASARERETGLREARSNRDIDFAYDAKALADAKLGQARAQIGQGFGSALGGAASFGIGLGALKAMADEGAKVQKTPGKFSHEENEMYVVDEEGKSMGLALTGGEYVIDPARANRLKNKAKDSSLKGMKVLRKEVQTMVNDFEKAD